MSDKQAMMDAVAETAKGLGFEVQFNSSEDLRHYRPGEILTAGQVRALPDGAVVWWQYKEHGESDWRADEANRITWDERYETLSLSNGSSFGGEFSVYMRDDELCEDDEYGPNCLREAISTYVDNTMYNDLGDVPVDAADDADVPMDIWLKEEDGAWVLTAGNYMPRKGRVSEDAYKAIAPQRETLVNLIHQHWLPLYCRAVEILTEMKPGRYGAASLYYWK